MHHEPISLLQRARFVAAHAWPLETVGKADKLEEGSQIFFTGFGRSGTQLLTRAFAESTSNVCCVHEPFFKYDVGLSKRFRTNPAYCASFWIKFRRYRMEAMKSKNKKFSYLEVNGALRYQISGIRAAFPHAEIYGLARDPRTVIRSLMGWKSFYEVGSPECVSHRPLKSDRYYNRWADMSKFEKLCWLWADGYSQLLNDHKIFRLEDIIEMPADLLTEINIDNLDEVKFATALLKPSDNSSAGYIFPHHTEWTPDQIMKIRDICGETAARIGYSI